MTNDNNNKRHALLTAFLILMIAGGVFIFFTYVFFQEYILTGLPNLPIWLLYVLASMGIINIASSILLFNWKKLGFYGFCFVALLSFIINISIGIPIFQCLLGLAGVFILFGLLNIGGKNKAWPKLE